VNHCQFKQKIGAQKHCTGIVFMLGNASQNKEVLSLTILFFLFSGSFLKEKKIKTTWKWNVCPSLCCHQFRKI